MAAGSLMMCRETRRMLMVVEEVVYVHRTSCDRWRKADTKHQRLLDQPGRLLPLCVVGDSLVAVMLGRTGKWDKRKLFVKPAMAGEVM